MKFLMTTWCGYRRPTAQPQRRKKGGGKMSVSILEALENADYNFQHNGRAGQIVLGIAKSQLHNAVILLQKGYSLMDEVEPLLEKYGEVDNVPDKEPK